MPWRPRALLLDFHGVIAESTSERGTSEAEVDGFVARLHELVDAAVPPELIAADLEAGFRAYGHWRDAMARPYAPAEITHARFWADFVCADWPAPARAAVLARATELVYAWATRVPALRLREGVMDVLEAASADGIPVAVVSNTLCGAAFRDFLAGAGLGQRFAAQIYSDEAGVRKPNPALVLAATDAIGVAPEYAWFVGDTPLRDVLAARRAGVGLAVLVRSGHQPDMPPDPRATPDLIVDSMLDIHRLLVGVRGS